LSLDITFQPNEETIQRFKTATKLQVKKKVNSPSSFDITFPDSLATRKLEAYSLATIKYNDYILFDGKSQEKGYGKEKITLKGYDWLWDFANEKRAFFQKTDARPDQLFTNAFDQDEVFDMFGGNWDTYSTPWVDGFDARTFVVPAETAEFVEFFDGDNVKATDFMKNLADVSFRGPHYTYYYWFENEDGVKSLHFEPEGWGKTWDMRDNANFTVVTLKESLKELYNNVMVWGKQIAGELPQDTDFWTESNDTGYSLLDISGGVESYHIKRAQLNEEMIGDNVLEIQDDRVQIQAFLYRTFVQVNDDGTVRYPNWETLQKTQFYVWYETVEANVEYIRFYMMDSSGIKGTILNMWNSNGADGKPVLTPALLTWHFYELDGLTTSGGWTYADLDTDWENFWRFGIWWDWDGNTPPGNALLMRWDGLKFNFAPVRSSNTSEATGYSETSADDYGLRTLDINKRSAKNVASCNAIAGNALNYFKDPVYKATAEVSAFVPFKLNDSVKAYYYDKLLTLPITAITWSFDQDKVTTKIELGRPRIDATAWLEKNAGDVSVEAYDRGITYYLY